MDISLPLSLTLSFPPSIPFLNCLKYHKQRWKRVLLIFFGGGWGVEDFYPKKRESCRLVIWLFVIFNVPFVPPSRILCASLLRKWVKKFGFMTSRFQAFVDVPRYLGKVVSPLKVLRKWLWAQPALHLTLGTRCICSVAVPLGSLCAQHRAL